MTADRATKLYNSDILGLATEMADFPFDSTAPYQAETRSRSCGSTLDISISLKPNKSVKMAGLRVKACAIGQASAVLFANDVSGRSLGDLERAFADLKRWLLDGQPEPEWRDIGVLNEARAYPARHEAILLSWKAAIEALSKANEPS